VKKLLRWLFDWAKTITVSLIVWFVMSRLVLQAFRITSSSMVNTVLVGDVLFVNKLLYGAEVPLIHTRLPAIRDPRHGDIVTFRSVEEADLDVVKRLIGEPGDTLAMREGVLVRNGRAVDEPWIRPGHRLQPSDPGGREKMRAWQVHYLVGRDTAGYAPDPNNWGPIVVPPDSFFMMGDNRADSWDSRYWGFLPRDHMTGKAEVVYYSYDPDTYKPVPVLSNIRWRRIFTLVR
jgi:signal peptidase I